MGKGKGKGKKKQTTTGQTSKSATKVPQKPEETLDNDLDYLELEDDIESGDEVTELAPVVPEAPMKSKQPEKFVSVKTDTDLAADNPDDVVEENGAVANPPVEKKMTRKELKKMKKKV